MKCKGEKKGERVGRGCSEKNEINFFCVFGRRRWRRRRRYLVAKLATARGQQRRGKGATAAATPMFISGSQSCASCASSPLCNLCRCNIMLLLLFRWLRVWVSWHLATCYTFPGPPCSFQWGHSASFHCLFIRCALSLLLPPSFLPHSSSRSSALFRFYFFRHILLGVCSFTRNCIHGMQAGLCRAARRQVGVAAT